MTFVQANKVPAVQRQHDSVASGREIDVVLLHENPATVIALAG